MRVVPDNATANDLTVRGEILKSNAVELQLAITAIDARGEVWLEETYTGKASRYAYQPATRNPYDPFQAVYNTIANDLLEQLEELTEKERGDVRLVTELRFARDFSPEAFDPYLEKTRKGEYEIKRLPSENDPMLKRVRDIRERNNLYEDTLQIYYANFDAQVFGLYQAWRMETSFKTERLQSLRADNTRRIIIGGISVLAGLAAASSGDSSFTRTAGQVAVLGGSNLLISGARERIINISPEVEALKIKFEEAAANLEPQVLELEDDIVLLSGSVEEQYAQWYVFMGDIYRAEIGSLELPEESADTADTL